MSEEQFTALLKQTPGAAAVTCIDGAIAFVRMPYEFRGTRAELCLLRVHAAPVASQRPAKSSAVSVLTMFILSSSA